MTIKSLGSLSVRSLTAVAAFMLCVSPLSAARITDPPGDFLPSFTGPHNDDLDVLEAEVFFDGTDFLFTSTSAGPIGTTSGGTYVWGVNRGAGFATFPVIAPGVHFDAVALITPGGSSFVLELDTMKNTPISDADISVSGAFLSVRVAAALLPSLGFTPKDYTVNLWPRSEPRLVDEVIADFAPDNSNAGVTVVPEPATAGLTGALLAAALWRMRRRR